MICPDATATFDFMLHRLAGLQRLAFEAQAKRTHLRSLVEQDETRGKPLPPVEIARAFSLEPHLVHVATVFRRVFGQAGERPGRAWARASSASASDARQTTFQGSVRQWN